MEDESKMGLCEILSKRKEVTYGKFNMPTLKELNDNLNSPRNRPKTIY